MGAAKLDLARQLVKCSSRFLLIYDDVRKPMGSGWKDWKSSLRHFEPLREATVDLLDGKWEAELLMDSEVCKLIDKIIKRFTRLRLAAMEYHELQRKMAEHPDAITEEDTRNEHRYRRLMYGTDEADSTELESLVSEFKAVLKKEAKPDSK